MAPDLEQLLSKTRALLRQREMTVADPDPVIRHSREIVAALMHNAGKLKTTKEPDSK
jgi:hypothetical protein